MDQTHAHTCTHIMEAIWWSIMIFRCWTHTGPLFSDKTQWMRWNFDIHKSTHMGVGLSHIHIHRHTPSSEAPPASFSADSPSPWFCHSISSSQLVSPLENTRDIKFAWHVHRATLQLIISFINQDSHDCTHQLLSRQTFPPRLLRPLPRHPSYPTQ